MELVFDYWKNHDTYLNILYQDGELNLGDESEERAEDILNENTLPTDEMVEEAKLNGYHYHFEYDKDGIWLLDKVSSQELEDIKDFFEQIWTL